MILIMIHALIYINVRFFDIGYIYINLDTYEKVYFISGKKFEHEKDGTITVVFNVLYGTNSNGASFHK